MAIKIYKPNLNLISTNVWGADSLCGDDIPLNTWTMFILKTDPGEYILGPYSLILSGESPEEFAFSDDGTDEGSFGYGQPAIVGDFDSTGVVLWVKKKSWSRASIFCVQTGIINQSIINLGILQSTGKSSENIIFGDVFIYNLGNSISTGKGSDLITLDIISTTDVYNIGVLRMSGKGTDAIPIIVTSPYIPTLSVTAGVRKFTANIGEVILPDNHGYVLAFKKSSDSTFTYISSSSGGTTDPLQAIDVSSGLEIVGLGGDHYTLELDTVQYDVLAIFNDNNWLWHQSPLVHVTPAAVYSWSDYFTYEYDEQEPPKNISSDGLWTVSGAPQNQIYEDNTAYIKGPSGGTYGGINRTLALNVDGAEIRFKVLFDSSNETRTLIDNAKTFHLKWQTNGYIGAYCDTTNNDFTQNAYTTLNHATVANEQREYKIIFNYSIISWNCYGIN